MPVVPLFIFDTEILKGLPRSDSRVSFIHTRLKSLGDQLAGRGGSLQVLHGRPFEVWQEIFAQADVKAVFCNEDYEPQAIRRDAEIEVLARQHQCSFTAVKDQVVFAKSEVVKDDGQPYRVFTPYSRRWKAHYQNSKVKSYASERFEGGYLRLAERAMPSLKQLGFSPSARDWPAMKVSASTLKNYADKRDGLALDATSRLGVHLRFGTIPIRALVRQAVRQSEIFFNELLWREFFMQILFHFPHSAVEPFDPRYKKIEWRNNAEEFKRWCNGETGYDLVDAGMCELNATGFMHNRARMVVASFLTKHLLIDWRWGERYFAEKLLDFELSSNVGNWQWAAGSGCDAAPYFRVFNPELQAKKFDPKGEYVARWLGTRKAHSPKIVDHEMARRRAVVTFRRALK